MRSKFRFLGGKMLNNAGNAVLFKPPRRGGSCAILRGFSSIFQFFLYFWAETVATGWRYCAKTIMQHYSTTVLQYYSVVPSWYPRGTSLVHPWCHQWYPPPWYLPGTPVAAPWCTRGALVGSPWYPSGPSGSIWVHLGPSWDHLWSIWVHLGSHLGPIWVHLGPSGSILDPSLVAPGAPGAPAPGSPGAPSCPRCRRKPRCTVAGQ